MYQKNDIPQKSVPTFVQVGVRKFASHLFDDLDMVKVC